MLLPSRHIHLDFHTSPLIRHVASDFNAKAFAQTMKDAHVASVCVFARCHHGMLYYRSKAHPELIHPGLDVPDLLDQQIDALHAQGIKAPIYTTVQWDEYMSKHNPQWCSLTPQGAFGHTNAFEQTVFEPGFYRCMCVNTGYRQFLKEHIADLFDHFGEKIDGLFLDIVMPVECCCEDCLEGMRRQGLIPHDREHRMQYAYAMLSEFKRDMAAYIRTFSKDCTIFFNRGHVGVYEKKDADCYSHFELESIPSGEWGYMNFPVTIRYARMLQKPLYAHTGKFHIVWGDMHSYKNQAALDFECQNMQSFGARVMVGDQLEPKGVLNKWMYERIGKTFSDLEKAESLCEQAQPVSEIAVFSPEEILGAKAGDLSPSAKGIVRMFTELAYQFDIIDSTMDFSPYSLLVLPDVITLTPECARRLEQYIRKGGKVLASFQSGLNEEKSEFILKSLGVALSESQTCDIRGERVAGRLFPCNDYTDYLIPKDEMGFGLPPSEHAMYIRGYETVAEPRARVLLKAVAPVFDRTYEHFSSHRQSPSSGRESYDAVVQNDQCVYFSHPLFMTYDIFAPLWYKQLVKNAIEKVLNIQPVLTHDGPSTLVASLMRQPRQNRYILHLLHYIPERRAQQLDIIEDVIPLYNLRIAMPLNELIENYMPNLKKVLEENPAIRTAITAPDGNIYAFPRTDGGIHNLVPQKLFVYTPWLKQLNMEVPSTPAELEAYLQAVKDNDMNGNGDTTDEIPLIASSNNVTHVLGFLLAPFEPQPNKRLNVEDGVVTPSFTSDSYREGLKWIRSLCEKGLFSADSFTMSANDVKGLTSRPEAMIVGASGGWFESSFGDMSVLPTLWEDYEAVPPLANADGVRRTINNNGDIAMNSFITTSCTNPAALAKWCDFWYSYEGIMTNYLGVEGVGWNWIDEPSIAGNTPSACPTKNSDGMTNRDWYGTGFRHQTSDIRYSVTNAPGVLEYHYYNESLKYMDYLPAEYIPSIMWFVGEQNDVVNLTEKDLISYVNEMRANFITGIADINDDAAWEAYLAELDALDLTTWVQTYQDAYAAMMSR